MVEMRLKANGFEVISAKDGEEGISKAHEEHPDLILLDIIIPKMDGYEVCKHLKADSDTKDIPVIIMTASGAKGLEDKCLGLGVNDIVRKPYNATDLFAKIKSILNNS